MVLCEDDERRFGGGFLFLWGGCCWRGGDAEGEKLYLWERGDAGAGFLGTGRDSGRGSS